MLTLQELLNGVKCLDENTLAELSDKLWELGTLDDIKEKVNNAKAKTIEQSENLKNNVKEAKSKRDIIEDATEKRKIQNYKFKENLDDELSKTRKVYESLVKEEKELLNIMNTLTNVSSVDIAKDMFNDLTNEGAKTEVISSDSIKPEVNVRQIPDDNTEEYSTDTFMFNTKDFDKLEDLKDNVRKTSAFIKILIIMLVIIVLAGLGFLVYKFLLK